MEKKMKEIQLNEMMEKTRRIEEMKQEKEEMKRKIAQQGGKINQLRWSNNRLAADCDELLQVKQHMETVVVAKNKQFVHCMNLLSPKNWKEHIIRSVRTKLKLQGTRIFIILIQKTFSNIETRMKKTRWVI